jgi:hypothetical protein
LTISPSSAQVNGRSQRVFDRKRFLEKFAMYEIVGLVADVTIGS